MRQIYISQGEEAYSAEEDVVISTVLGSCIAMCFWDPQARVGGMNHLLLPELSSGADGIDSVGAVAVERLINQMVRCGAVRDRLRAKLFGGASMLSGMTEIGSRNSAFARDYLEREGIACDAESTGGTRARRIQFRPACGSVRQRFVKEAPPLRSAHVPTENGLELF